MLMWFAKRMREARKDEKGFTLIELLVVVIIIGILAAIAIPIFLNQRASAQDRAAEAQLRSAASAQSAYYAQNNSFSTSASDLGNLGFPRNGTPAVTVTTGSATDFCMTAPGSGSKIYVSKDEATSPVVIGSGTPAATGC